MKNIFLQPGAIIYSSEPVQVTTVLGSCVSVCIYDTKLKTGGICHYYLPNRTNSEDSPNRYGDFAIPNLLKQFKRGGSEARNLTAKVLGGGAVLATQEKNIANVGIENARLAKKLLSQFDIPVTAHSIGGRCGRKIRFNTFTGDVEQKLLHKGRGKQTGVSGKKIKVMIIDDSKTVRKILKSMVEKDPSFSVLHEAENPMVAERLIQAERPDVITLDIKMPIMDGVTFLRQYLQKDPIPTVIVTSLNHMDSGPVFQALDLGATDYLKKPTFNEIEDLSEELHAKLKNAFSLKQAILSKRTPTTKETIPVFKTNKKENYLIAIGASTGGTHAIMELLVGLPPNIPPVVIVLHIPPVFSKAYADRINGLCEFEVKEAEEGDEIRSGRVLLAPGGKQMRVMKQGKKLKVRLTDDPPLNRFKPSVDYLFNSLVDLDKKIIGVLLTGMGKDGAMGLLQLKQKNNLTIAQDEASSVVFGMPKAAMDIGAVVKTAHLQNIPGNIVAHIEKP